MQPERIQFDEIAMYRRRPQVSLKKIRHVPRVRRHPRENMFESMTNDAPNAELRRKIMQKNALLVARRIPNHRGSSLEARMRVPLPPVGTPILSIQRNRFRENGTSIVLHREGYDNEQLIGSRAAHLAWGSIRKKMVS